MASFQQRGGKRKAILIPSQEVLLPFFLHGQSGDEKNTIFSPRLLSLGVAGSHATCGNTEVHGQREKPFVYGIKLKIYSCRGSEEK